LRVLKAESGGRLAFIGVGGVRDGETAREKLAAGADLVQAYTGFVYGGPGFARQTLRGLTATAGSSSERAVSQPHRPPELE
jgi:dihydroorotate dehydrogenase